MKQDRFYVDLHIIQTVPPSCINRDDTGRPKTAVYGGVQRARVSSQAWKHAMREMFAETFEIGYRTKSIKQMILDEVQKLSPDSDSKIMSKRFDKIISSKIQKGGKPATWMSLKDDGKVSALFFISPRQVESFAKLLIADETDVQKYRAVLKDFQTVDIALFGRMVADDAELNVNAAAQVAHSISTHAIQNEYDYFTAVDDCSPADNAGAGHLGTMEFNSATLYRYATVNVSELISSLGADAADAADALRGFAQAFICAMPTGKQNSYANRTLPDLVYVTIRRDQPVNLSGAFERPIGGHEGFAEKSEAALFDHAEKVYADYCGTPERSFVIGHDAVLGAERVDLRTLLEALYGAAADGVV